MEARSSVDLWFSITSITHPLQGFIVSVRDDDDSPLLVPGDPTPRMLAHRSFNGIFRSLWYGGYFHVFNSSIGDTYINQLAIHWLFTEQTLILYFLAQSVAVRVREDAEIRLQRLLNALLGEQSCLICNDARAEIAYYPSPGFRSENAMMRQQHIAEEVDTLSVLSDRHFVWMKIEMQLFLEKRTDGHQDRL